MRMKYFNKLPQNYQDGLNRAIAEFHGEDDKLISDLFRDSQAESLLECEIYDSDIISQDDIGDWITKLCWFIEGWRAKENSTTQPTLL